MPSHSAPESEVDVDDGGGVERGEFLRIEFYESKTPNVIQLEEVIKLSYTII